jgi:hypothetical protein
MKLAPRLLGFDAAATVLVVLGSQGCGIAALEGYVVAATRRESRGASISWGESPLAGTRLLQA